MTDPDVPGPSDPYLREHLHWYTLNIPKKILKEKCFSKKEKERERESQTTSRVQSCVLFFY